MERSANEARAAAESLLRSGYVDDPTIRSEGTIGDPLPIRDPDGAAAGWFVPVTAGDLLYGFFQFDERMTLLRFSRFPKPPAARNWLDADSVRRNALAKFPNVAPAGEPFMTWDRAVTRLVWAVPVRGPSGEKLICVAGDSVWM